MGLDFKYSVALNEEMGNVNCGAIPMSVAVQTDMATPALARYTISCSSNFLKGTVAVVTLQIKRGMSESQLYPRNLFNHVENVTETISRTDEGQPRPKYIFNKSGTNIYFFYSKEVWSITITEF